MFWMPLEVANSGALQSILQSHNELQTTLNHYETDMKLPWDH